MTEERKITTEVEETNDAPFPQPSTGPEGDEQNEEAQDEEADDDSDDNG